MELKLEQYLLAFASWRKSKLQAIDRKTRKLVATYGALQSKSDADRLYRPRKEGGRGLISIEACFELAIRGLEVFFFFSIWVFFHEHSQFTEQQGKGEGICLTPLYNLHPLYRHLDISRAITADSSPLHIASSRTRTGNRWFPSASR